MSDSSHSQSASAKPKNTRQAIVLATKAILQSDGFTRVSVSSITQRAQVTRSLFYHYFADKESAANAALDSIIDDMLVRVKAWDEQREVGNIAKALEDFVQLAKSIIVESGPFGQHIVQSGNAKLYIDFIDRVTERVTDYLCNTTVQDFAELHNIPITYVRETFHMLIPGLIAVLRLNPTIDDVVLKQITAQTLHLERYL